jgi:hypothetical protein
MNIVLRETFGHKREQVGEEWRKLHCGELGGLYSPPKIIRVTESRRIERVGYVARMGRDAYHVFGVETWGKETTL